MPRCLGIWIVPRRYANCAGHTKVEMERDKGEAGVGEQHQKFPAEVLSGGLYLGVLLGMESEHI
jgi:hypothetical protein